MTDPDSLSGSAANLHTNGAYQLQGLQALPLLQEQLQVLQEQLQVLQEQLLVPPVLLAQTAASSMRRHQAPCRHLQQLQDSRATVSSWRTTGARAHQ
jgi:hypothetical protein